MKHNPQNAFVTGQEEISQSRGLPTGKPSDSNAISIFTKNEYTGAVELRSKFQSSSFTTLKLTLAEFEYL
ncbi:MAG: hypothetical protein Q8K86_06210 [Candidatus Nanopelagicaceae bacterium]|nr:hypothetical protein [Candidatus Nanopelagicaceae bacterium]